MAEKYLSNPAGMLRFSLLGLLLLLFEGNALRANEVLERHIDVRFRHTPLREALATVAQKANFEWSYNANLVDAEKKISLTANDWTVRETLYEILGDGYEFKARGNYLILKKRSKPADRIFGYVKDPNTGQRIANATVYDRRSLCATTTDSNGFYQLKVKKNTQIAVARLSYRDTIFPVTSQSPRLQKIDLQLNVATPPPPSPLERSVETALTQTQRFFRATLEQWAAANVSGPLHRRAQVSFLPKIGTNHTLSGKVVNDWSLNVLAGVSLGNRKAEVGGLANFTRQNLRGVQIAGLFNEVSGGTSGLQLAGLLNQTGDTLHGAQIAGLLNFAKKTDTHSVQIGGLANVTRRGKTRVQIAGTVNSAEQIQGVQIAGVLNRARKVKGVQIGLFNSARTLDGLQIGLFNRSGRRILPILNW
jgi:hypothetical protein